MSSTEIRLEGDPRLRESIGTFDIIIDGEQVDVGVPDRFGHTTAYTFSRADWARIVELINHSPIPVTESN